MLKLLRHGRLLALAVGLAAFGSSVALASSTPKPVEVGDFFFAPQKLTMARGTSVKWQWGGFIDHNVAVATGPVKFHSRIQAQGTFSHRFTKPGTYTLHCTLHPALMRMTIVVK